MDKEPEYEDTVYTRLGFEIRYDYFTHLSEVYDIEIMDIILMAEQLGIDRDFTGLMDWVSKESKHVIRHKANKGSKKRKRTNK